MSEHDPPKPAAPSALQAADLYRMQVRELRDYAMFMLDPQGILTSWNAGVENLLGYSEQEWIGRHASIRRASRTIGSSAASWSVAGRRR